MEKADILEMTVRYLRHTRHTPGSAAPSLTPPCIPGEKAPAPSQHQFNSGFRACVHEIAAFLDSYPGLDEGLKHRLLSKLKAKSHMSQSETAVRPPPSAAHTSTTVLQTPTGSHPMLLRRNLASTMDIQCTLSLQSPFHSPMLSPHQAFSPALHGVNSPMASPAYFHPYLSFTPIRSSDFMYSPEMQSTPRVKREPKDRHPHRTGTPPSGGSANQSMESPMWRPW